MRLNQPLRRLANVFDPCLLELLNEVLLEFLAPDRHLLLRERPRVNKLIRLHNRLDAELLFVFLATKQHFPAFLLCQIPVHQNREIVGLNVLIDIVRTHDGVDMLHWTDGVFRSRLETMSGLERDVAETFTLFYEFVEVALTCDGRPQLEVFFFGLIFPASHHVHVLALRHCVPIHKERLEGPQVV